MDQDRRRKLLLQKNPKRGSRVEQWRGSLSRKEGAKQKSGCKVTSQLTLGNHYDLPQSLPVGLHGVTPMGGPS